MKKIIFLSLIVVTQLFSLEKIDLGVDVFFKQKKQNLLADKKIALLINQTSVNKDLKPTLELFLENASKYKVVKIFTPEHGINGASWASENVIDSKLDNLDILSLHGPHKRPTSEMLQDVDVIIYDLQEIGCRSYTYATTLFYVMEEAAKKNIKVIVLDRPNPINGNIVDGPMLDEEFRSFLGYINVPYCHGMTIGELSKFFNSEYNINCNLEVISMNGWKRDMTYVDTKLSWIPTSPNIPESDTPLFYATTGILGELELVSIGIGYTLPFKIVGAPWIDAKLLADNLNKQKLSFVKFVPYYFKPFYGAYKNKECQGVKIEILDKNNYKPMSVGFLILGILKTLYPDIIVNKLKSLSKTKINAFCLVNGNKDIFNMLLNEKYAAWKMIQFQEDKIKQFQEKRKKHLIY